MTIAEQARRQMLAEYAQKAGRASQASGRGHRWSRTDARHWGRLGGQCTQELRRRRTRCRCPRCAQKAQDAPPRASGGVLRP
jgi:hypothetical protein